jgi:hypothetical protein
MPHALWLLFRLRFVGFFRRIGVGFRTTKGALLTIISLILILTWLTTVCGGAAFSAGEDVTAGANTLEKVERFAPFALLAYCALVVTTSSGAAPIAFTPAEIQFLFSAPFTRRQLLSYKLINQFLLSLPICVFGAFGLRHITGSIPRAFFAAFLTLTFMQLFALAVSFVAATVGELVYSRTRKLVLLVLAVALVWAAGQALHRHEPAGDLLQSLQRVEQSQVLQWIVTPFRWYVRMVTARQLWPDFVRWGGICLTVNAGLLALVYLLDASYLESSAAASERRYAKLARMRSSGSLGGASVRAGKVRFGLPMLPWLGGAGPLAWRQLTAASRSYRALTILMIAGGAGAIGPIIATSQDDKAAEVMPWMLAGMGLFMTLMLGQFFAYDFRADVDRIEVLKTLPVHAWRIVAGQLITPVLFATGFQVLLVGVIYAALGKVGYVLLGVVLFGPPINLLLAGVENGLFLLFPTRLVQTTPGDLSQAGRQFLVMLTKMLTLLAGTAVPALFGLAAFWIAGESWVAAVVAAWPVSALVSVVPLPFVAMAFRNFDVARDTPP